MSNSTNWKEDYLSILSPLAFDVSALERANILKAQNLPNFLYRYRHFDSNGYALSAFENDCVWLASPGDFNDPFDSALSLSACKLLPSITDHYWSDLVNVSDLKKHFTTSELATISAASDKLSILASVAIGKDSSIPASKKGKLLAALMDALEHVSNESLMQFSEAMKCSLGICCFTERPDSVIMWSHYADHHKGFCIEYTCSSLANNPLLFRCLHPVTYSDVLFDATDYLGTTNQAFNILLSTIASCQKSPDWAYEHEWRLVIPFGIANTVRQFHLPVPHRVILGAKTSKSDEDQIRSIADRKGILVHRANLAANSFAMKIGP